MPAAHRMGDKRANGRPTIAKGNSTVFANFKPMCVQGDRDPTNRAPIAAGSNGSVYIANKLAVPVGARASAAGGILWWYVGPTVAATGSPNVNIP